MAGAGSGFQDADYRDAGTRQVTLPFVMALAAKGWEQACSDDPHLAAGVNVRSGELCV